MRFDQFGPEDQPPLLFILGWSNQPTHEPVRWFVNHLTGQHRVHTATLPVHVTDIPSEWVRLVEQYATDLDDPGMLGEYATPGQIESAPERISPATLGASGPHTAADSPRRRLLFAAGRDRLDASNRAATPERAHPSLRRRPRTVLLGFGRGPPRYAASGHQERPDGLAR